MSKKTQTQTQTEEKTALQVALEETTTEPTREERLADFLNSYGKLITVDFTELAELVDAVHAAVDNNTVSEHPDVVTAREAIIALEAKLGDLDSLPEDIRKYASLGIKSEIAACCSTIAQHKEDNPVRDYMLEHVWFALHDAGKIKFGKASKKRSKRTSSTVSFDSKSLIAFSYQTKRTLKDGVELNIPLTKGYIVGSDHPKVVEAELLIPNDKLGIFSEDGILMGKVSANESKGSILGTAVVVINGGDEDTVRAISSTGVSGLDQGKSENKALLVSIPELKASMLTNGRNSELAPKTAGTREMAESAA